MPSRRAVRCSREDIGGSSRSGVDLDHISSVELNRRFQDLSTVLDKARDSFSCRLEEEQVNPLKELRIRLLKAKERFHARLANFSSFPDPCGFYPAEQENPFQELRTVLRSARINFVPLLDQYILDNSSNSRSLNPYEGHPNQASISTCTSLDDNRETARDREPPGPTCTDLGLGEYSNNIESRLDDESPSRLHWLLEEETRFRRRSTKLKSSNAPAAALHIQPQTREEGHKNSNVAPRAPAPASSAQRLDLLIYEELDRKKASGTTFSKSPRWK